MRIRTGHQPDDWTENVPSGAWLSGANGVRGALVVGNPGQNDQGHKNAKNRKAAALKAETA